jgi:hypothetical protein
MSSIRTLLIGLVVLLSGSASAQVVEFEPGFGWAYDTAPQNHWNDFFGGRKLNGSDTTSSGRSVSTGNILHLRHGRRSLTFRIRERKPLIDLKVAT